MILSPLDEYPIHQFPAPVATPATSDPNFYDRAYFNVLHREGNFMVVTGIGYYPRRGVKDAFVAIRRDATQTVLRLSDAIDDQRLTPHVNSYQLTIGDPLKQLQLTLCETEGISLDLSWNGLYPAALEAPHVMSTGNQVALNACRFAQVGQWTGQIVIDGSVIAVEPKDCVGSRDRSWGIRPIGEPAPAGRPPEPPFEGLWWLYMPLVFDDFAIQMVIQENAHGARSIYDCTCRHQDGTVEHLDGVRVDIDYLSGTRLPRGAHVSALNRQGDNIEFDVVSKTFCALALGSGYSGDSSWSHGTWRGPNHVERLEFDLDDAESRALTAFSVVDHTAVVTCSRNGATEVGVGLFEHAVIGLHHPSGFTDWTGGPS